MTEQETINACECIIRHTEVSGAEVFEKCYHLASGDIAATVFAFVGENAAELTAMVREMLHNNGMNRNK